MAIPSYQNGTTDWFEAGGFTAELSGTFDVGSDPASILAFALAEAGSSAVRVNRIVIGGIEMVGLTDRSFQAEYGSQGRCRGFELIGSGLTGVQPFTAYCTLLDGVTADPNSKPAVVFASVRDVVSRTTAALTAVAVSSGNQLTATIASNANSRVFALGLRSGAVMTAVAPTDKPLDQGMGSYTGFILSEVGAASTQLVATSATTDIYIGQLWSLEGTASGDTTPPTITGPSGGAGASTSSVSVVENTTAVHTFTASEAVTWSISGGADAALFTINSSTGALSFLAARNFEAPADADTNNTYVVVVRATDGASNFSTQTVTVTVTNANEAPTYSGTISVPALTVGVAMTPVATAGFFSDVDAGDTAAYSAIGTWPAGITVNASTGAISGTPTVAGTYSGLQVRRADSGSLTATSTAFAITVAASGGVTFTGTVPGKSGTVGVAFAFGSPALDSYFSGTGTYAVQAGTLPPGLTLNASTGAITGTPTTAGTYSGIVVRKTAASGSPATADTNAFAITIAAAPVAAGFNLNSSTFAFRRNNGTLIASTAVTFWPLDAASGDRVGAAITGLSTNASGIVTSLVSSASLVAGTTYRVNYEFATGEYGVAKLTAA